MFQFLNAIKCCLCDNGVDPNEIVFIGDTSICYRYNSEHAYPNQIHICDVPNCQKILSNCLSDYAAATLIDVNNHGDMSTVIMNYIHEELGNVIIYIHPAAAIPTSATEIEGIMFSDADYELSRATWRTLSGGTSNAERLIDLIYDFPDDMTDDNLIALVFILHECHGNIRTVSKTHRDKLIEICSNFGISKPSWLQAEMLFR